MKRTKVVDPAVPTVIAGTKDFNATMAEGASAALAVSNVVVNDQYGRPMDLPAGYSIKATSSDPDKVDLSVGTLPTTVTTLAKGSSTITLVLNNGTADVPGSDYTFTCKVVEKADIASYELADFAKLYEVAPAGSDYAVAVKVSGVMADSSKVTIPSSYYEVVVNDSYVSYDASIGKLTSATGYSWGDATERKVPVTVIVDGANGPVTLTKDVTVSNVAPAITTLSLEDGTTTIGTVEGEGVVSAASTDLENLEEVKALVVDVVKAVDQYGVEFTDASADYTVSVTNLPSGKTLATLAAGDTFNVTAVSKTNKVISFKVIVK